MIHVLVEVVKSTRTAVEEKHNYNETKWKHSGAFRKLQAESSSETSGVKR